MKAALAILILLLAVPGVQAAQSPREVAAYEAAFAAMLDGNWQKALDQADDAGQLARDIIEWHRLRAGLGDMDDARVFLDRRADWPGLQLLRRRNERHLPFGTRADAIIDFFGDAAPQTGHGAVALIGAYRKNGMADEARTAAIDAWLTHRFSPVDEALLLSLYEDALKPHHEARLDMLLWRDAETDARRMFARVPDGWKKLAEARIALRDNRTSGIDVLVNAVPKALADHPGLMFERMQWRARKGRNEGAIEIFLDQAPDALGQPQRWAGWRRSLARSEMRAGRTETAYRLASENGLDSGSAFADLEWLAGYIALTYQEDGEKALGHFLRFRGAVETPISLGRAGYWEGRAHELIG
ncbi:MAG: lytic transglycosylase domain-containing protein, partial [Pseudomonadota bacterium]